MKPELVRFTDGVYCIVGAHLTLEEAREQFGKEYGNEDYDYDLDIPRDIVSVKQCWIRYEYLGEYNCPDDYECEPGDALWLLYMSEKRPKGVVRKVTVINE